MTVPKVVRIMDRLVGTKCVLDNDPSGREYAYRDVGPGRSAPKGLVVMKCVLDNDPSGRETTFGTFS